MPLNKSQELVSTLLVSLLRFWNEKENYLFVVTRTRAIWLWCIAQLVERIFVNNALIQRIQREHLQNIEGKYIWRIQIK